MEQPEIPVRFTLSPELKNRVLSAGILAPLVLGIVWYGGLLYQILILLAAVVMSFEWSAILHSPAREEPLTSRQRKRWVTAGVVYTLLFAAPLFYLRTLEAGFGLILLLLLLVWSTDIAAYFTGRAVGGPKICPRISPKKTWAGLGGGMVAAGLVGAVASVFIEAYPLMVMVLLGMFLAVMAQIGDFLESWVKRCFGVKDSGTLIPGHGGIMDRLDGFVTSAPVMALLVLLHQGMIP